MYKFITFLFLIAAILGYALFSFYGAYAECYESSLQVKYSYDELKTESESLALVSVKVGTLALKYLPNARPYVNKLEKSSEMIQVTDSVSTLAKSCALLYSTIKQLLQQLNENINAKRDYHLKDAELQFNKISRDIKITTKKYNIAAKKYNETLNKPSPQFWDFLLRNKPAEFFTVSKK